jgi:hypothetical protein
MRLLCGLYTVGSSVSAIRLVCSAIYIASGKTQRLVSLQAFRRYEAALGTADAELGNTCDSVIKIFTGLSALSIASAPQPAQPRSCCAKVSSSP